MPAAQCPQGCHPKSTHCLPGANEFECLAMNTPLAPHTQAYSVTKACAGRRVISCSSHDTLGYGKYE